MTLRIISGIVLGVGVALVFSLHPLAAGLLIWLGIALGLAEVRQLLGENWLSPGFLVQVLLLALLIYSQIAGGAMGSTLSAGWIAFMAGLFLLIPLAERMLSGPVEPDSALRAYIGSAFSVAAVVLATSTSLLVGRGLFPWALPAALAVCWAGDAGGLFAGSLLGREKLAPTLSPRKTREGAVGTLLASAAVALAIYWWWEPARLLAPAAGWVFLAGLVVGFLTIVGDLSGSYLKRLMGVKDASRLLPGQGGVFDKSDSLILALPTLTLLMLLGSRL